MQKAVMIQIPEERYELMLKSYDEAVKELFDIKEQLHSFKSGSRQRVDLLLNLMDETQLRKALFLIEGVAGGAK